MAIYAFLTSASEESLVALTEHLQALASERKTTTSARLARSKAEAILLNNKFQHKTHLEQLLS